MISYDICLTMRLGISDEPGAILFYLVARSNSSVGRGDSSHFPHIYNSLKTGRAGIVCSSVMVVPHMTFMHSEYP